MNLSQLPNGLTFLRVMLIAPIVITLLNEEYFTTVILFLIAGITDVLDGFVAKRFNFQSRLGSILDPMADKLLLTCVFFTMLITEILPLWLFIIIFVRDIIIVTGAIGYFIGSNSGKEKLHPSSISKINTVVQISSAIFIILAQLYPDLARWLTEVFIITATTTFLSGADYIWLWFKKFILQEKTNT